MRKNLHLVFIVVLLVGCSPKVNKSTVSNSCKNQIQDFLTDQWFYDEADRVYWRGYRFGELTKTSFAKDGCLQALNRNDVISLFGKPSKEIENKLYYYYHKTCFDNHLKCPTFLEIKLNDEGYFEKARTRFGVRVSH